MFWLGLACGLTTGLILGALVGVFLADASARYAIGRHLKL